MTAEKYYGPITAGIYCA